MFEVDQDFGDTQTLELKGKEPNTHILKSSSIHDDRAMNKHTIQPNFTRVRNEIDESRDALPSTKLKESQLQVTTSNRIAVR